MDFALFKNYYPANWKEFFRSIANDREKPAVSRNATPGRTPTIKFVLCHYRILPRFWVPSREEKSSIFPFFSSRKEAIHRFFSQDDFAPKIPGNLLRKYYFIDIPPTIIPYP